MGLSEISTVDAILLAILALATLGGARRGLLREVLELLALGLSGFIALRVYSFFGGYLAETWSVPGGEASLLAFALVFLIAIAVLSLLAALVARALGMTLFLFFPRPLDWLGGALVGLAKGALILALTLHALVALPVGDQVKANVASSGVADRIERATSGTLPLIEGAFGRIAQDALKPPQPVREGERQSLNLPKGLNVWTDPDSEAVMLQLLNQERALAGLAPLVADERLRTVARAHSEEMFRLSYFAHESPLTGTPFDRLRVAGIQFTAAGENLAYAPTVEIAHRGLMNSPDHRRNILTPEFRRVGIGVMQSSLWGRMFTQDFTN